MKLLLLITALALGWYIKPSVAPLYVSEASRGTTVSPTPTPKVDELVDTYSKKYGKTTYQANRIKVMLHFLLLKEQNYGGSTNCGDSGLACGPMQYHYGTYKGYRTTMMKQGLVMDMGSRLDMEDSIETAAWAIADGREKAWGPIRRGEIKL